MQEYTKATWPTDRWINFSFEEAKCRHTGFCFVDPSFMDALQKLRYWCEFPFPVTSLYRDRLHPVEASKKNGPGLHSLGIAVDIAVYGREAYSLVAGAGRFGFTGILIEQSMGLPGNKRFIHLDMGYSDEFRTRPWLASY